MPAKLWISSLPRRRLLLHLALVLILNAPVASNSCPCSSASIKSRPPRALVEHGQKRSGCQSNPGSPSAEARQRCRVRLWSVPLPPEIKYFFDVSIEHLQEFMSATPDVAEKLTNAYTNLQGMLAKPLEVQTTKDPKDHKNEAVTILKPTYSCLQCNTVSSMEDRELHGHEKRHRLCMDHLVVSRALC